MKLNHVLLFPLGLAALGLVPPAWSGAPPSKKIQKLVDRDKAVQAWTKCRDLGDVAHGDDQPLRSACADAHYGFLLEVYEGKDSLADVLDEHWTLWSGTRAATQSRERAAAIRLESADQSSVEILQEITARYSQTEAAERVIALLWSKVKKAGTSAAMEAFIRDYPNSRASQEALQLAQSLLATQMVDEV